MTPQRQAAATRARSEIVPIGGRVEAGADAEVGRESAPNRDHLLAVSKENSDRTGCCWALCCLLCDRTGGDRCRMLRTLRGKTVFGG